MAPLIHCVRHAQGLHNLTEDYGMVDPLLTAMGKQQCRELQQEFPFHSTAELIVASPLRRTIYTALLAFAPVFERNPGLKIIALPDLQEVSDLPCDCGSDLETLKKEVRENNLPVDLSLVPRGWQGKNGRNAPHDEAILVRARDTRRWLEKRPEEEIIVVAHGGLLHYFTEDWENGALYPGTGWKNMEYRTYQYANGNGKESVLVETDASRHRRGKLDPRRTQGEQQELYCLCRKHWDQDGVQLSAAERANAPDI